MSTTTYNCDQCSKVCTEKTVTFKRYKNHFCGKVCKGLYQKGAKERAREAEIARLNAEVRDRKLIADAIDKRFGEVCKELSGIKGELGVQEANVEFWERRSAHNEERGNKLLHSRGKCFRWALVASVAFLITAPLAIIFALKLNKHSAHSPEKLLPAHYELVIVWTSEDHWSQGYVDHEGLFRSAENGKPLGDVVKWGRP